MSKEEVALLAKSLPLRDRVALAQELWQQIDHELLESNEDLAVKEALVRDAELESGKVVGRSHEDVMAAARRAIGCA